MGVSHLTAAFNLELDDPKLKSVLIALANYASDEDGECWPAIDTLARNTGWNRRTVQRAIKLLEQGGHLKRYPAHGPHRSVLYKLLIVEGVTDSHPKGVRQSPRGCQRVTQTVKEPSTNASDARAKMIEWQPSKDVMTWATGLHPEVDMEHQVELFRARCLAGTIPDRPDDAFRMWVGRISELRSPPPLRSEMEKTRKGRETAASKRKRKEEWEAQPAQRIAAWRKAAELQMKMGNYAEASRLRNKADHLEIETQVSLDLTKGE